MRTATTSLLMWMGADAMLTAPCSCIPPQSAKWGPSYKAMLLALTSLHKHAGIWSIAVYRHVLLRTAMPLAKSHRKLCSSCSLSQHSHAESVLYISAIVECFCFLLVASPVSLCCYVPRLAVKVKLNNVACCCHCCNCAFKITHHRFSIPQLVHNLMYVLHKLYALMLMVLQLECTAAAKVTAGRSTQSTKVMSKAGQQTVH